MTRRNFIKTGLIFVPTAAFAATTVVVPPRSSGVAAAPPFTPVGNPNNPNGNGSSHGNKQTRPMAGATIDWGNPITNGLVGCWLCNENGGSTLYDTARGRNAALSGDTPNNYWGVGTLAGFLEPGRGVAIRNTATANGEVASFSLGTNRVTVMLWAWFNTIAGPWVSGNACFVNKEPVNAQWLLFCSGGTDLNWRCGTVSGNTATTAKPADYIWHQLAGTFDGTTNTLYVNGVSKATSTPAVALIDTSSALEFGRFLPNNYLYYGTLGPIYIWNRALNALEVETLYNEPYQFIY